MAPFPIEVLNLTVLEDMGPRTVCVEIPENPFPNNILEKTVIVNLSTSDGTANGKTMLHSMYS